MVDKRFLLGRCVSCEQFVYNNDFKEKSQLDKFAKDGMCYTCQITKDDDYDVSNVIEMITEISEEQLLEALYGEVDSDSFNDQLTNLFNKYDLNIISVAEGNCDRYDQPTSKDRILAALYEIKNLERGNDDFQ